MIGSWEIQLLDKPEEFLELSKAYLEASRLLCSKMIEGELSQDYNRSRVVLFLAHHAVELFLKGAILERSPSANVYTHSIADLLRDYDELYREDKLNLEVPFRIRYLGFSEEQIMAMRKREDLREQIYRYPTNRKGDRWQGSFGFDPQTFLSKLYNLGSQFNALEKVIRT